MSLIATEILDHSGRKDYRDCKFTRVLYTDSLRDNSRLKGVVKMLLKIHFTRDKSHKFENIKINNLIQTV